MDRPNSPSLPLNPTISIQPSASDHTTPSSSSSSSPPSPLSTSPGLDPASPPHSLDPSPSLASPTPKTPVHRHPWLVDDQFSHSPTSISHRLSQLTMSQTPAIQEDPSEELADLCDSPSKDTHSTSSLSPTTTSGIQLESPLPTVAKPLFGYSSYASRQESFLDSFRLQPVMEAQSSQDQPKCPSAGSPLSFTDLLPSRSPPTMMSRRGPSSPSNFQMRFQSRSTPPPSSSSFSTSTRRSPILSPTPTRLRTPPPHRLISSPDLRDRSPVLSSRFNEPFLLRRSISLHSTSSSTTNPSYTSSPYLRAYSMPSTPTSTRSRSPSISSLETIPDTPDAEAEALLKEKDEEADIRRRRADFFATGSARHGDLRDRSNWDPSPSGLGLSRDKRKRWSVCGGERRADLDLETIWED